MWRNVDREHNCTIPGYKLASNQANQPPHLLYLKSTDFPGATQQRVRLIKICKLQSHFLSAPRQWSDSWSWSVNVTDWAAPALCVPAGWPCPTSGRQETTCGGNTMGPSRWPWIRMGQVSLWLTKPSGRPPRLTWSTLRTLRITAYKTNLQVRR